MDDSEFIRRLEEIHKAIELQQHSKTLIDIGDSTSSAAQTDPDQQLKLELQALLQEPDLIKRMRLQSEIASHYRLKKADIQEALKHLE